MIGRCLEAVPRISAPCTTFWASNISTTRCQLSYTVDQTLQWGQALPLGIARPAGATWSGHANDVLPMGRDTLVASQMGGVWLVAPDGVTAVGDSWGQPDLNGLVRGSNNAMAMAFGKGIYVSDWTAADPLRTWQSVPMPAGVAEVYRALFVPGQETVVRRRRHRRALRGVARDSRRPVGLGAGAGAADRPVLRSGARPEQRGCRGILGGRPVRRPFTGSTCCVSSTVNCRCGTGPPSPGLTRRR